MSHDDSTTTLKVEVLEGRNLIAMDSTGTSDPYVIVSVGGKDKKTKVIRTTLAPKWKIGSQSEKFSFKITPKIKEIVIKCMDWDRFSADDRMGQVTIPLTDLPNAKVKDDWFTLVPQKTGDPKKLQIATNPLAKPVHECDYNKVDELLKDGKTDINFQDEHKVTALHMACTRDVWNEGAVQVLLRILNDPKTNVKLVNEDKNSAFHYFCKKFTAPHVVGPFARFIERGVEVNAKNSFGETPVHQAVFNASLKTIMLDLLRKENADMNAVAESGETPLHYAVRLGREDVVKFLIAAGANVGAKSTGGKTAYDIAIDENFQELAEVVTNCKEMVEWLESTGLSEFRDDFIQNDIFLYILPDLTDELLQRVLPDANDRKRVMTEAKKLTTDDALLSPEDKKKKDRMLKQLQLRKQESRLRQSLKESARKRLESKSGSPRTSPQQPNSIARKVTMADVSGGAGAAKQTTSDVNWEIDPRDLEFAHSLGAGSSGEVFQGMYEGKQCAIKVLKTTDAENEVEEFKKEFQVLVTMSSPYVIKFYGACLTGKLAMVMEFCGNGSLYDVLNKKDFNFTWDNFFQFALEVCNGVNALHTNTPTIMHRDLKTLNFLVSEDNHVKVCDFGLSRFNTGSNMSTLAKCRGTYAYIAPEVYNCENFTTKSDMYAVGMMLWELMYRTVTGTYLRPFQEYKQLQFDFQILIQACKMKLRPTIPKTCPAPIEALIRQCWHETRDSRLEAAEVITKVNELQADFKKNPDVWNASIAKK